MDSNKTPVVVICGDELTSNVVTGIPRYAREIVYGLDKLLDNKEINCDIQLCYPQNKKLNIKPLRNIKPVALKQTNKNFRSIVLSKYACKNKALLIIFSPTICMYDNTIITIHDIRPLEKGSNDSLKYKIFNILIGISLRIYHNSYIVTVSNFQKNRISSRLHIKYERIEVIGNGWEHIMEVSPDRRIFDKLPFLEKNQYYYSIGSVAKHKNYEWILSMATKYTNRYFVIAGNISKSDWNYDTSKFKVKNIIFTGYISDEESKALLIDCKALLHPSKYEGFAIPPLEALALDKRIMISNSTCLPEIFEQSAIYFKEDDYEFDLDNLDIECTYGRENILQKHSWESSANMWLEFIKKYIEGKCDEKNRHNYSILQKS